MASGVEWDPEKARANQQKHGIAFSDAVSALEDPSALTIEDENEKERRFITLGMDAFGRLLVVVYTYRAETIRLISARRATAREHQVYQSGE